MKRKSFIPPQYSGGCVPQASGIKTLNATEHSAQTINPIAIPATPGVPVVHPEFCRLPKAGTQCPWTGLSRSTMWQTVLRSNGQVKTVCLRRPGAIKGTRLIHLSSLLTYLHSQSEVVQ